MKKRVVRAISLLLSISLLVEASATTAYASTVSQIVNPSSEIHTILQANRSFYEGYSIDESFLLWFGKNYGYEMLGEVAKAAVREDASSEIWYTLTGQSIHVLWLEYCQSLCYSTYLFSNVHYVETKSPDVCYLDFIGDVNFDDDWSTMQSLRENGDNFDVCISQGIQSELQAADLAMMNNEFVYSTGGAPLPRKAYTFRSNPDNVKYLDKMGIDLVNLANNHVWDYGEEALLDTLSVLQEAGVDYVGAGKNLKEASQIQYYVMNGRKIAIVSATQIEKSYNYTKEATASMAGVLKTQDPTKYVAVIKKAKQNSDYVIANVHWGTEAVLHMSSDQRVLAKAFADAGADLIIGNHSHRLQGMSYMDGVPVVHSLGNFWFCTGKLYTTILQVSFDNQGEIGVRFLPCMMEDSRTYLIQDDEEKERYFKYVCDLSEGIAMDGKGSVYPTLFEKYDKDMLAHLPYHSGKGYASHSGKYDLNGSAIDIVGDK